MDLLMKDEWFSDHMDLPKWGVIHHLAGEDQLDQVSHIPFFRESKRPGISVDGSDVSLDEAVWKYFRNWKRMETEKLGDLAVRIFAGQHNDWGNSSRQEYFDEAIKWLSGERGAQLVLLDPDTGLAPESGGDVNHVRIPEVEKIWMAVEQGSIIAIYQHAPRGVEDWVNDQKKNRYGRLGDKLGVSFKAAHLKQDHPKAAIFWAKKT